VAAWDALAVYISYNLTFLFRIGRWEGMSLGLSVALTTWLIVSYLVGQYSPRSGSNKDKVYIGGVLLAASAVVAVFVGHSWIYQVADAQTRFRGFLIPTVLGSCALSSIGQTVKASIDTKKKTWLILASGREAEAVARELRSESRSQESRNTLANSELEWETVHEQLDGRKGIAVGTLKGDIEGSTQRLLQLREQGECIIPLMSWCERELQRIPPELVHPEWLIQAEGFGLRPGSMSWRLKRFADIAGALALITATSPLVLLGCIAVWAEDKGPVLYSQIRSGLYGRPIRIWKIRSMKVDAETRGPQWSSKGDARVTRVGRVIRATRIDELPQLLNVVSGELSLIGPRPERPEIEVELEKVIPNYRIRHWIRPGLSGWAQVCYRYGASTEDSRAKLSYDLYYLRNASVFLDILITIKTIRMVLKGEGAAPSAG